MGNMSHPSQVVHQYDIKDDSSDFEIEVLVPMKESAIKFGNYPKFI